MRKSLFVFLMLFCIKTSYADAIYSILNSIRHLEAVEENIKATQTSSLHSQQDIENLMKQLNGYMAGHSGWGTYQFRDYQSYGQGADTWSALGQTVQAGGNKGQLGQVVTTLAREFPMDNRVFSNATDRNYYTTQSQTILGARAASQLDYDKVQNQIAYQQMLQQQIEKTKDLKSAVDLNNRIQVEANLINLQILRQAAIANQQQAMTAQGGMNSALSNAKFLTKK